MSQNEMKFLRFLIAFALFLASFPELVLASRHPDAINHAPVAIARPSRIFYGGDGQPLSPELIAVYHKFKKEAFAFDMRQIIPLDLDPNDDSHALQRVADRTATYFFNTPEVRNSVVGRAATQVEQSMKQEVIIGTSDDGETQHKFNFNIQAFQAIARLEYTGFMRAALRYKPTESSVAFEVAEKIYHNQDLVVSQTFGHERISEVSLRWSF